MAYAVVLDTITCQAPGGCTERATHEVRDRWDEVIGKCCPEHARQLVDELRVQGR